MCQTNVARRRQFVVFEREIYFVNDDPAARELAALLLQVAELSDAVSREGREIARALGASEEDESPGAREQNLGAYLALRRRDITALQERLAALGLSSLGRSEGKVRLQLDALLATLRRLNGEPDAPYPDASVLQAAANTLPAETTRLFGPPRAHAPQARIMATLPPEAADDPVLAEQLIAAGMDCARINCAYGDVKTWSLMIEHVRAAGAKLEVAPRVLMDVAGPKCRINEVQAPAKYRLRPGERVAFVADIEDAAPDEIAFSANFPAVVDQLSLGRTVSFDDGRAVARVIEHRPGRAALLVQAAREKGVRLKPEKGVNFIDVELTLPPLTRKDLSDLDFIAEHADLVGFSFVQRIADVERLQAELALRRADRPPQGVVLKIETPLAVKNLPQLIVASARRHPTAVMIARGDLAVEIGFARLSEMQEEILWLCEAAHTPTVWATEVLDQFVRDGLANRSEMTDAAMGQSAECVMLNKGPHLVEGVAFLRDVLSRMDRHRAKRFERYSRLKTWG
jgi:pyruvate kinase